MSGEAEAFFQNLGNQPKPPTEYKTHWRDRDNAMSRERWENQWKQYNQDQADYRNYMLAKLGYEYDLKAREYDSPVNQMNRLRQAGLNPNLAYSQLQDSASPSFSYSPSSAPDVPSASAPSGFQTFASALDAVNSLQSLASPDRYYDMRLKQQSLDMNQQRVQQMTIDTKKKEVELTKSLLESEWMKDLNDSERRTLVGFYKDLAFDRPFIESKRYEDFMSDYRARVSVGRGSLDNYYQDYYRTQSEIQSYQANIARINSEYAYDEHARSKRLAEAREAFNLELDKMKKEVDNPVLRLFLSYLQQYGLPDLPGFSWTSSDSFSRDKKGNIRGSRSRGFNFK